MNKISILCPSRGRPHLAKKMIDSAIRTSTTELEIKLYLNDNDPELQTYIKLLDKNQYSIGPDRSPGYSWNLLAEQATGDIMFLIGDDAEFITHGWDVSVINEFLLYTDKIACVYPITGSVSKKKNPHFCLHRNWIDALGYFVPPQFWHWYVDTWVGEIARRLDRYRCLQNVQVSIQTRLYDETERRTHDLCLRERDIWIWNKSKRHLEADIQCLKTFIDDFKEK